MEGEPESPRMRRRGCSRGCIAALGITILLLIGVIGFMRWAVEDSGDAAIYLGGSKPIVECRTPLGPTASCSGRDKSWTECNWTFRAEGTPPLELCERFLRLPSGRKGEGDVLDYDDVEKFSEVDCRGFKLPDDMRCFRAQRSKLEERQLYLQAFDGSCRNAVILRACNSSLEKAAAHGDAND